MDNIIKFTDIFKKTFLEGFPKVFTTEMMIFTLMFTLFLSFIIYFIYRANVKELPFSKSFAVSMSLISVITAGIIIAVQSSIIISLGMVGALSIVRFRTAIKSPMDLLFLFWSISLGIISGAGLYTLALASLLVLAFGITVYQVLPNKKAPHLLIVSILGDEAEDMVIEFLKDKCKKHTIKSRSLYNNKIELTVEIAILKEPQLIARSLNKIEGIESVTMLAHDGVSINQ